MKTVSASRGSYNLTALLLENASDAVTTGQNTITLGFRVAEALFVACLLGTCICWFPPGYCDRASAVRLPTDCATLAAKRIQATKTCVDHTLFLSHRAWVILKE